MGRIFFLALFAMIVYFSLRSLFKPFERPPREPVFKKKDDEASTEMAQDPECGVYVDPLKAVALEEKGKTYYFCSDDCRRNFHKKLEQGEAK